MIHGIIGSKVENLSRNAPSNSCVESQKVQSKTLVEMIHGIIGSKVKKFSRKLESKCSKNIHEKFMFRPVQKFSTELFDFRCNYSMEHFNSIFRLNFLTFDATIRWNISTQFCIMLGFKDPYG